MSKCLAYLTTTGVRMMMTTSLRMNGEKRHVTTTIEYSIPIFPSRVATVLRKKVYPSIAVNCAAIPKRKARDT